jgi:hypothetical protein
MSESVSAAGHLIHYQGDILGLRETVGQTTTLAYYAKILCCLQL